MPSLVAASSAALPADLKFSPADVAYLMSVDAATREAAIKSRRNDLAALQQGAKLNK
jgi:hypothetical protein